jgi:hypothetical protein
MTTATKRTIVWCYVNEEHIVRYLVHLIFENNHFKGTGRSGESAKLKNAKKLRLMWCITCMSLYR